MTRTIQFDRVAVGARVVPPVEIGIDDPVRRCNNRPARLSLPGGRGHRRREDLSCRQDLRSRLELRLLARQIGGEVPVKVCGGEEDEAVDGRSLDELRIRLDAEKVGQFGTLSFRKAIRRVCAFLEINPKTEAKTEGADTIVFSDTLNYVDFRKVLNGFVEISQIGWQDYCPQFAPSGKPVVIFRQGSQR
jgi:hypothetical protein